MSDQPSKFESNWADYYLSKRGALVPGMIRQGRGARRLLSLGGVRGGVSPSRGGHSVAPGMIRRKRGVVRMADSV